MVVCAVIVAPVHGLELKQAWLVVCGLLCRPHLEVWVLAQPPPRRIRVLNPTTCLRGSWVGGSLGFPPRGCSQCLRHTCLFPARQHISGLFALYQLHHAVADIFAVAQHAVRFWQTWHMLAVGTPACLLSCHNAQAVSAVATL
jgi:hypothetical protein